MSLPGKEAFALLKSVQGELGHMEVLKGYAASSTCGWAITDDRIGRRSDTVFAIGFTEEDTMWLESYVFIPCNPIDILVMACRLLQRNELVSQIDRTEVHSLAYLLDDVENKQVVVGAGEDPWAAAAMLLETVVTKMLK